MRLRKFVDYLLVGLLIFIPFISLIQFDETIYPYVTSKYFTFRFVVLLAGGLWLAWCVLEKGIRLRSSYILKSLLVFLAVVFIANLFGANFWNSFWSNYSRMEGFLSLLFLFLFFLLLSSVLYSVRRWQWYWLAHVAVSIVILVIAVLQKMRLMLAVDYNRVDSVFGNASYLAIYASMVFFLCLYLFLSVRTTWVKAFILIGALCNLASIYLSQTRSATLAVLACLGFFTYSLAKNKWKTLAYVISAFVAFVAGVFFLKSRSGVSTNLFERIAQISMKDTSTQARVEIWAYCWRAFLDSPVVGWGQENFSYLAKFFRPQLWSTPWVDRAHNIFLEWMVNAGALGLIAVCLVMVAIVLELIKIDENRLPKAQKMALLSLLACWFINGCLSIDFFSNSILFYSVIAFIHFFRTHPDAEPIWTINHSEDRKTGAVIVFIAISLMLNFKLNVGGLQKNMELRQFSKADHILQSDRNKNCDVEIAKTMEKNLSFEEREFRSYIIQNAIFILGQFRAKNASEECVKHYYEVADQVIQRQLIADPDDLFFKHIAANFYTQFFNFPKADSIFQELLGKVPQQQNFWIDYGHWNLAQGRLEAGLSLYQKAYDLDHENPIAIMYLAMGMVYNKRFVEGDVFTDRLIEMGRPEAFDERLLNAFIANSRKEKIEQILKFKDEYFGPTK